MYDKEDGDIATPLPTFSYNDVLKLNSPKSGNSLNKLYSRVSSFTWLLSNVILIFPSFDHVLKILPFCFKKSTIVRWT